MSGLMSFAGHMLLNSVIIYPVTRKILTNEKFGDFGRRKIAAILFLAAMGFFSVGVDLFQTLDERNLFKIMQVPRTATAVELKKSYQRTFLYWVSIC